MNKSKLVDLNGLAVVRKWVEKCMTNKYGAPLVASSVSAMSDITRVYVYTGVTSGSYVNGHWYFWDGSAWVNGGAYNSIAVNTDKTLSQEDVSADAKVVGDAVKALKNGFYAMTLTSGTYIDKDTGTEEEYSNWSATDFIAVDSGSLVVCNAPVNLIWSALYDANKQYISGLSWPEGESTQFWNDGSTHYIRISGRVAEMAELTVKIMPQVDTTLEKEGYPADAKVTGDVAKAATNLQIGSAKLSIAEAKETGLTPIESTIHFETRSYATETRDGEQWLQYLEGSLYADCLTSDPMLFGDQTVLITPNEGYEYVIDEWAYDNGDYYRSMLYPLFQREGVDFKHTFTTPRYFNTYRERYYTIWVHSANGESLVPESLNSYISISIADNRDHIPDYYQSYLNTKINTINDRQSGFDKFSFAFITDIHTRQNTKHGIALLREVYRRCALSNVLGGGDWNSAYNYDFQGKDAILRDIQEVQSLFDGIPIIKTAGNHEWGYGGFDDPDVLTLPEVYNLYYRDCEQKAVKYPLSYGSSDGTYYYQDDTTNKVRYISINSTDYPEGNTQTGYFVTSAAQKNWLKETALDLPDNDWLAVIFSHSPLRVEGTFTDGSVFQDNDELLEIVDNFYHKTDFAAQYKGTLVCWIAGHRHQDWLYSLVDGAPTYGTHMVITTSDSIMDFDELVDRTKGTVSEQAFDVFTVDRSTKTVYITRVGANVDRSFAYQEVTP